MQRQQAELEKILQQMKDSKQEIVLFYDYLMFDETLQDTGFDVNDANINDLIGEKSALRSSWNVMVQIKKIGWEYADGSGGTFSLVIPACIMIGAITADAFWSSLFAVGWAQKVNSLIMRMRRLSNMNLGVRETDADGKCRRVLSHEVNLYCDRPLPYTQYNYECQLHQVQLATNTTVETIDLPLMLAGYSYSKLQRMGNY